MDRIFCHSAPVFSLLLPENQNFEKLKETPEDIIILDNLPKIMIICYTAPEIWCMTDVIVIFHLGLFFALLYVWFLRYDVQWTNEQTDRQMNRKSDI